MICPRCHAFFFTPPVLSRHDNKTLICSDCALLESLESSGMKAPYRGPPYWTGERPTDHGVAKFSKKAD
jgi:hypothetical protein